jgi:hypothetical protein
LLPGTTHQKREVTKKRIFGLNTATAQRTNHLCRKGKTTFFAFLQFFLYGDFLDAPSLVSRDSPACYPLPDRAKTPAKPAKSYPMAF